MNLYHVHYTRQVFDEGWRDTDYRHQGVVVLAENIDEAKKKIRKCLDRVETGKYRAVTNWDVKECIGLSFEHGFEDSFYVTPIEK